MTREEAIKILKEHYDHWMRLYKEGVCTKEEGENTIEALEMAIKALEQEPRKGHWIKTPKAVMGEGYMWYCNKCEHQVYQDTSRDYPSEKYCPNCGCKMIEPQERKDKE